MLGERLKRMRLECHMTQPQAATALGVSKQAVSNWENGYIVPSIKLLKKLCLLYNCSSDYLLGLIRSTDFIIDTKKLTSAQVEYIQRIVKDFEKANKQYEKTCENNQK